MSGIVRLARLALLIGIFTIAARLIPTGGALNASPIAGPDAGNALLDKFEGGDRALVARGRRSPVVGTPAPELNFRSFTGGTLALDALDRVVVLAFAGADCPRCVGLVQELATLSVVFYEDVYTVAVATEGSAKEVSQTVTDVGGAGLVLGAEDMNNMVAKGLKIKQRPTLVVVGAKGTVDALWTEDVPLNVLYTFLKAAYELDAQGEAPLEPSSGSGVRDG